MSFRDKLKHQAEEATVAGADAAGAFDPPIDEEEVAEDVLWTTSTRRRPSTLVRSRAGPGARPQRAYDASGEPVDELPLEPDAPDVPGASSGSW